MSDERRTDSGIEIKALYTADDLPRIDANHIEAVAEELDAVIAE